MLAGIRVNVQSVLINLSFIILNSELSIEENYQMHSIRFYVSDHREMKRIVNIVNS